ncbi:hypothetical protein L7F22_028435 [Adiantum nelumboides]|nr:hypothetical protein [Adiantum nelumboides]
MERFEVVKEIGSGNFGVANLLLDKKTQELFAAKYIERGSKIDANVQREIINHRSLQHPNIIRFKEVFLTSTHLAILMEYAAGGELFQRICNAGRFSEDEVLLSATHIRVSYCHDMQICHRDLKLENTLLDDSAVPRLKICDFGYSKSSLLHSQPKSTVGTPAYIAPEVLAKKEYDGKIADVWSCGVTLYVMLVGSYPFEDPQEPRNFRKSIGVRFNLLFSNPFSYVQYTIPDYVRISLECRNFLSQIFIANPEKRITIAEIKQHPWFLKNLPKEMQEEYDASNNQAEQAPASSQLLRKRGSLEQRMARHLRIVSSMVMRWNLILMWEAVEILFVPSKTKSKTKKLTQSSAQANDFSFSKPCNEHSGCFDDSFFVGSPSKSESGCIRIALLCLNNKVTLYKSFFAALASISNWKRASPDRENS